MSIICCRAICQLLEQDNHGILPLLDEPRIQVDDAYLTRLEQCCSGHMHCLIDEVNVPNCFQ